MPILMSYEDGLLCPKAFCDHCGDQIEHHEDGHILFENPVISESNSQIYFVCKGRCDRQFTKTLSAKLGNEHIGWTELKDFPIHLANNLELAWQAVSQDMMKPIPDGVAPIQKISQYGWIYFAQSGTDGAIKIGFSKNVKQRLKDIQCSSPEALTILAIHPGSVWNEQQLHKRFGEDRCRANGEWFRPSVKLLRYIWKRGQAYDPSSFAWREKA